MPWQPYHTVWALLVFGWIGNYMVRMAFSPLLGPVMAEFELSHAEAGFLFSVFFYGYVAMQIPAGLLGDRFGRKRVLVVGILLVAASALMTGLARTLVVVGLARLVTGLAQGMYFANDRPIIAAATPRERLAVGQGVSFSGLGLGNALGVIVGGALGEIMPWRAVFLIRDLMQRGIREYLHRQGFVEVHTPKLAGAGAEGGATLFRTDYFGRPAYLSQSPQLYKQMLMATGLDRVFELSPAFRAEPSDTVRHVTEFLSFDAEVAFIRDQEDFLTILEGCVAHAIAYAKEHGGPALDLLAVEPKVPALPLPRVRYSEAIDLVAAEGKKVRDGDDLDTEAEKVLGRAMAAKGHDLYFITEYPSSIKPFYVMVKDDDLDSSLSFDLEFKGDEMASGGQREHRYDVLVARMKEMGLTPDSFEFYLKTFRYGMPPHGGWGLGIDRLVQKTLDLPNIREAILFPRDRTRLVP